MAGNDKRSSKEELIEILTQDLYAYAKYINPHYCYGDVHEEVFRWLANDKESKHQLLLMPRGHLKSHCMAVWCSWQIARDPTSTIVYLAAREDLALAQLAAIKGMITCDRYRHLWPEMLAREEGKRSKWAAGGFNVDHPLRREKGTRDLTVIAKTLGSSATGLHCSHLVMDDVVIPENAYTSIGRRDVKASVSQFAAIKSPAAYTKSVGTRYHSEDLYSALESTYVKNWNEEKGCFDGESLLWDVKEYATEDAGDMTGTYLWPRTVSPVDKQSYGFNAVVLSTIQAEFFGVGEDAQFYAQYYGIINHVSSEKLNRDSFQFYRKEHLVYNYAGGYYEFDGKRLKLVAAMDVAWTVNKSSDYTAIAVVGMDCDYNMYVLALDRFKTDDYTTYYEHVIGLHNEWGFKKLHIETNAGGHLVASELKRLLRTNGSRLYVEGKAATGNEGKKEEKHNAILIPRIKNGNMWFEKGGLTSVAIEEITLERPPNDDLKDVLTLCCIHATPPSRDSTVEVKKSKMNFHKRFGGRVR